MTLGRFCGLAVCIAWLLPAIPVSAHHSAAVAYDLDKYITLEGVITEVKWENPHTWIYVDVRDASGTVVKWAFEGAVPNQLYRRGVTPALLKAGMQITIKGHPARDPSRQVGELHEVVLQDGRSFVIGAGGTGPRTPPSTSSQTPRN